MGISDDFIKNYGPLIFWFFMFAIIAIIKAFAFKNYDFWIVIPPELALWSTGILFTLASSEETYRSAKIKESINKKDGGKGITIDYDVVVGDDYGFKARYLYLFLFSLVIWLAVILVSLWIPSYIESAETNNWVLGVIISIYYLVSVFITVIAIQSTIKINK